MNSKKISSKGKTMIGLIMFVLAFNSGVLSGSPSSAAQAAANLIVNGGFETEIERNWSLWKSANSARTVSLYRSYETPFGNGTFSAAIDLKGAPEDNFNVLLLGQPATSKFSVSADKNYYLTFWAKASRDTDIALALEDAVSYSRTSPVYGVRLGNAWQRYGVYIKPSGTSQSILAIAIGSAPETTTINFDSIAMSELALKLTTKEIAGFTGENGKCLSVTGLDTFRPEDVEVELPYLDAATGQTIQKRFRPETLKGASACFNIYPRTFSGIGRIWVDNNVIGDFTYTVKPKITNLIPALPRADEVVTIEGTGFSPAAEATYVVVNALDLSGKKVSVWIKPLAIDSGLKQVAVRLPNGVISGSLYVQVSYQDATAATKVLKSNTLNYKIKPVIFGLEWSRRGYDQVGDKVLIHGRGIANRPTVIYYDNDGKVIAKKSAKLIALGDEEVIEAETPRDLNRLNVTVTADGVESDPGSALSYTAKVRLTAIATKASRPDSSHGKIPAARINEIITLKGEGFRASSSNVVVEFQGVSGRLAVNVPAGDITADGKNLKVAVPTGAQNGMVNLLVNGAPSNLQPLEIIPTIVSYTPNPVVPGSAVTIRTNGMGSDRNLATVYFLTGKDEEARPVTSLTMVSAGQTDITTNVPVTMPASGIKLLVRYNQWRSDASDELRVPPRINEAAIEMDSRVLVIKGHGFSTDIKKNVITYMYADEGHTVISPKVRVLGVYPTEEGQEIRIQILDAYHYGWVRVTVDGATSNEANFGPVQLRRAVRRIEYVNKYSREMGVLYLSGYNFGPTGGVRVGDVWADVHYRSDNFIIAVVEPGDLYKNPIIIAKQ